MATATPTTDREVSGLVLRAALTYVERAVGADAVSEVIARTGMDVDPASLLDDKSWFTIAETVRVAEEAARVCGDPSIGRRTGEEQVLALCDNGFRDFIVALGSVENAMEAVLQSGTKMSSGRIFQITERGDDHLTIEAETLDPVALHAFFCDYVHGVFAMIPTLFGQIGRVTERECQVRGAARCRFELGWSDDPRVDGSDIDTEASAARFEERLASFEQLQSMASNLLGSHDLEEVLERICDEATKNLEAPQFLLAVRVGATDRLRVHHRGFLDGAVASEYAEQLLAGRMNIEGASALVTHVRSEGKSHGILAVLGVAGAAFSSWEARTIDAYARHAASALDLVAALDGAHRDRDTARALLRLAGELASVGTSDEVADRLTHAVPAVARGATRRCCGGGTRPTRHCDWRRGLTVPTALGLDRSVSTSSATPGSSSSSRRRSRSSSALRRCRTSSPRRSMLLGSSAPPRFRSSLAACCSGSSPPASEWTSLMTTSHSCSPHWAASPITRRPRWRTPTFSRTSSIRRCMTR